MRRSPAHSSSRPPLKKYVTCAYFSVSATCSWRIAVLGADLGHRLVDLLLLEGDGAVEVVPVTRHRRHVEL